MRLEFIVVFVHKIRNKTCQSDQLTQVGQTHI